MNKWDKNVFERTENYSTISKKKEKSSSLLFIISDICFWDSEVQKSSYSISGFGPASHLLWYVLQFRADGSEFFLHFTYLKVCLILNTECSVGHRNSADINLLFITLKMLVMSSGSRASWWQVCSHVNHRCSMWMCHFNGCIWRDKMAFHQFDYHMSRHSFSLNFVLFGFPKLLGSANLCPSQNSRFWSLFALSFFSNYLS